MQFLKEGVSYTVGQGNRPICDRIQNFFFIFWRISEVLTLSKTKIIYFDEYQTNIVKYLEWKSETIPPWSTPPL